MTITYKPIPRHPGYKVGTAGSVWSCHKPGKGVFATTWRRLRPRQTGLYEQVWLAGGSQPLVHRLVLEVFVGPCPAGMECCHADGNSLNNALDNLRWDTPEANEADK